MVSIHQAVLNAEKFAQSVLGPRANSVRLEEIEQTSIDGKKAFHVTLSFIREANGDGGPASPLAAMFPKRDYKTFVIDSETGDVISMKIRELTGAD
jgi:hypothetical protein